MYDSYVSESTLQALTLPQARAQETVCSVSKRANKRVRIMIEWRHAIQHTTHV